MKTLIELYDETPIENVLAADTFRPERVTLSMGYGFLEVEAKLSRKLMAWLKGPKKKKSQ